MTNELIFEFKNMEIGGIRIIIFGVFWLLCSSLWFVFGHYILGAVFIGLGLTSIVVGIVRLWFELRKVAVIDLDNQRMVEFIKIESEPTMIIPPR